MLKEKKDKKLKRKIILLISIIAIILFLSVFLYSTLIDFLSVYEKKEIYAQVIVSDKYGVAINGSALIFGMLPPGGFSKKEIEIKNYYNREVRVKVYSKGEITRFLNISENGFLLQKDEGKNVTFSVSIPKNTEFGIYEGKVEFFIRNPIVK